MNYPEERKKKKCFLQRDSRLDTDARSLSNFLLKIYIGVIQMYY